MSIKRLIVLGKSGQLARAFFEVAPVLGWKAICLGREQLNLNQDPDHLSKVAQDHFEKTQPHLVINASAFTDVDGAERDPEGARALNALAPETIAKVCAHLGIPFFHVSTDYVFSGHGDHPWSETDKTEPLNEYGRSKLEGENRVLAAHPQMGAVFRSSWVYSETGKGFMPWVVNQIRERKSIQMVNDQVGAPTYAPNLARLLLQIGEAVIEKKIECSGIYHCVPKGWVYRHELVQFIADQMQVPVDMTLVSSAFANKGRAARPLNSRLDTTKIQELLDQNGLALPTWESGVRQFLDKILKSNPPPSTVR